MIMFLILFFIQRLMFLKILNIKFIINYARDLFKIMTGVIALFLSTVFKKICFSVTSSNSDAVSIKLNQVSSDLTSIEIDTTSQLSNNFGVEMYLYFEDAFLLIIAVQCLCMGVIGILLSNKNLFLLLLNIELIYLGGGLFFAGFSAYWFYDVQGIIYAFCLMALAAAESVIVLSLFVVVKRRRIQIYFDKWKNKFNGLCLIISLQNEYLYLFGFFFLLVILLLCLLSLLARITARSYSHAKSSTYECGFESFGDARFEIQAQFYIIGLLFLLFDIELIFLFPWIAALAVIGTAGRLTMIFFLNLLMIGLIYEWRWKVLEIFSKS